MKLGVSLFDAVASDYNGTLADTNNAYLCARKGAFRAHDILSVTDQQHNRARRFGMRTRTIVAGLLKESGIIPKDADPRTHPLVGAIKASQKEIYYDLAQSGFDEITGSTNFFRLMTDIKGEGNISIVTRAHIWDVSLFIGRMGLAPCIVPDRIIASETVSEYGMRSKPAADPYLLAAQRMGVLPERMLVVENSTGGVESAKKAGCLTLALGTTYSKAVFMDPSLEFHPDLFAPSFAAIELVP